MNNLNKKFVEPPTFYNFASKIQQNMNRLSILLFSFFFVVSLTAQEADNQAKQTIFDALATVDSANKATVKMYQDEKIALTVVNRKATSEVQSTQTTSGYRVQVFSSNAQRTAKADAFKIEKTLREEFPDLPVYLNYTSPFWKVRVGDFKTYKEAQEFRSILIDAFPNLRSETYTVKDTVNL